MDSMAEFPPGDLNDMTFRNYKTYAWFKAREQFRDRHVDIPDDQVLRSQLAGMTWKFTSGEVIMLDTNEDVRERLGQSPDRATTLIMGLDSLPRCPVSKKRDRYDHTIHNRSVSKRLNWATV